MPKPHTFPPLYDEVLTISMFRLKEWKYLRPNQCQNGTIKWSRNGSQIGAISIVVNTGSECPYVELNYKHNDTPINYKVRLVSIRSNLGKGFVWFFICPQTGKRCRKLYSVGERFLHREAFKGCMYDKQTLSHKNRWVWGQWVKLQRRNNAQSKINSKHFKKYFRGRPTKLYLKLLKQIKEGEGISEEELLMA